MILFSWTGKYLKTFSRDLYPSIEAILSSIYLRSASVRT